MENNILNEIILGNWGGIKLNAKIDEELKDVKLMIKYSDHGDEFLIVKTENEIYEYGWWLNRKWQPEYDDLIKSQENYGFIRKPELFYAFDNRCEFSNKICWMKGKCFEDSYNYVKGYKQHSIEDAQRRFDRFIEYMHREIESAGIWYDLERYSYRRDLERYLKKHDILTEENIAKLDNVKWSSEINGSDGLAGKKLYYGDRLYGDEIEFIYHKGKFLDLNKVKMKHSLDDWHYERFDLSLKQFK